MGSQIEVTHLVVRGSYFNSEDVGARKNDIGFILIRVSESIEMRIFTA